MIGAPPTDCIRYDFDAGRVTSVRIDDQWHEEVPAEHFGAAALLSFVHARSVQAFAPAPEATRTGQFDMPPSVVADLGEQAAAFNRRAFALLARAVEMLDSNVEPPEPTIVHDDHQHVTLTVQGSAITHLEVSTDWLRREPERLEDDLKEALNRALDATEGKDSISGQLVTLQAEHRDLSRAINDFRRNA